MARGTDIVAGLDLGSSKIACVIAEGTGKERIITGVSMVPSQGGLRDGQVVSIEKTTEAIRQAVDEASRMAGCEISMVRIGIGGSDTVGINSNGTVAIRGGRVNQPDIDRVLENARALPLAADRAVLHGLPQEYIIDGHDRIRTPLGMNGVRLETRVHVITTSRTSRTNAIECTTRAGLRSDGVIFGGLASSASALTPEERELGCVLVDIGGGTTDLAVWYDHALVHTVSLNWGGDALTRQIARGLRTPISDAEIIKQRYGTAKASLVDEGETMEVPSTGGRGPQIRQRHLLCEFVEPELEDLFSRISEEIAVAGCRDLLAAGVILTGGTANLQAIADLGEDILLGVPVRVGSPHGLGGLSDVVADPRYATAVGLCLDSFEGMQQPVINPSHKSGRSRFWNFKRLIEAWF